MLIIDFSLPIYPLAGVALATYARPLVRIHHILLAFDIRDLPLTNDNCLGSGHFLTGIVDFHNLPIQLR